MSGVEVVGVVLGAVPLIISALEGYQKLGRRRDAFRRRSLHIDRMKHALSWQYRLIQSDVDIVLRNVELETGGDSDYGSYQRLLHRQDVQEAIVDFLGENTQAYIEVVSHCETVAFEIIRSLGSVQDISWVLKGSLAATLQANPKMCRTDSEFWRGVKFSMNKDHMDSAILDLDQAGRILERLREKSQRLLEATVQPSSSASKRYVRLLRHVQCKALSLHRALRKCWEPAGQCHDAHIAWLGLENRHHSIRQNPRRTSGPHPARKDIGFTLAFEGLVSARQLMYKPCDVRICSSDEFQDQAERKLPTVRFQNTPVSRGKTAQMKVDDICLVLEGSSQSEQIQLYLHEDDGLFYSHRKSDDRECRSSSLVNGELVSLRDLLSSNMSLFSLTPRVRIAAVIAASTLQLHSTPWCPHLRKELVQFARAPDGEVDFDKPLVTCRFETSTLLAPVPAAIEAESTLLDLGILILELWHNESIENYARRVNVMLAETYESRQGLARKWILETKDKLLDPVYEAAFRCVGCRFDAVTIDLNDVKLAVSIFEGVVKPLWSLVGISPH